MAKKYFQPARRAYQITLRVETDDGYYEFTGRNMCQAPDLVEQIKAAARSAYPELHSHRFKIVEIA